MKLLAGLQAGLQAGRGKERISEHRMSFCCLCFLLHSIVLRVNSFSHCCIQFGCTAQAVFAGHDVCCSQCSSHTVAARSFVASPCQHTVAAYSFAARSLLLYRILRHAFPVQVKSFAHCFTPFCCTQFWLHTDLLPALLFAARRVLLRTVVPVDSFAASSPFAVNFAHCSGQICCTQSGVHTFLTHTHTHTHTNLLRKVLLHYFTARLLHSYTTPLVLHCYMTATLLPC